ncbi:MAG: OmpA family protein [Planctomycetaceae bacterium]|jgi:flagellar motor protein MotB|nr:OmpA family protein [Planctomycetaceae bacterium]
MSRFLNNWRFILFKAALLTLVIGFFFLVTGCRSFSPNSRNPSNSPNFSNSSKAQPVLQPASAQPVLEKSVSEKPVLAKQESPAPMLPVPSTSYHPPTFLELENQPRSEATTAFSTIPEHRIVKKELLPSHTESKTISKNSENSENTDVLKRRIAELEKTLAEREKNVRQEKEPITVSKPIIQNTQDVRDIQNVPKTSFRVPTINHPGVTVSSDAERLRIEVIDQVLFIPGTWRLNPDAEELLRKIAGEIRANDSEALLEIEGHTDGVMNIDPANATQKHDISSLKTMVVMEYFVSSLRWNAARIKTSNFGSSRPVADNSTSEGRTRNNRIEIVVLPKKQGL